MGPDIPRIRVTKYATKVSSRSIKLSSTLRSCKPGRLMRGAGVAEQQEMRIVVAMCFIFSPSAPPSSLAVVYFKVLGTKPLDCKIP